MPIIVDTRGLACPQPVIMAQKAIEENKEATILVDNDIAIENIRRLAAKMACRFSVAGKEGNIREILLIRKTAIEQTPVDAAALAAEMSCATAPGKKTGPIVVILSDNRMGRGDDALGDILMRSFLHTLLQLNPLPDAIICYNAGVKLAVKESTVLDDLQQLEELGTNILVCGTCVNYFELGGKIAVGHISNMYDIAEIMASADRLLRP
jgi:selenium metabolism protein YedF